MVNSWSGFKKKIIYKIMNMTIFVQRNFIYRLFLLILRFQIELTMIQHGELTLVFTMVNLWSNMDGI